MNIFKVAALSALLAGSGCMTAPPAAPGGGSPELLKFYTDADAYQTAAGNRLCGDPALQPTFADLQRRLEAARQLLVRRYGAEQVQASRVAVIAPAPGLCSDRNAAATAVRELERAVSNLESALQ